MGTPTLKLMYDRNHRASKKKEGSIELRICYDRRRKYATTGVRVLPREWRNGYVVNRHDAMELQRTLDDLWHMRGELSMTLWSAESLTLTLLWQKLVAD